MAKELDTLEVEFEGANYEFYSVFRLNGEDYICINGQEIIIDQQAPTFKDLLNDFKRECVYEMHHAYENRRGRKSTRSIARIDRYLNQNEVIYHGVI